jgi:hypothetical protein
VIFETPDFMQTQAFAIHGNGSGEIGNRACYAQVWLHVFAIIVRLVVATS